MPIQVILSGLKSILKTTNAGVTWTSTYVSYHLFSVCFPASDTGYAVGAEGSNGIIIKTTDGGTTWNILPTETDNPLSSVFFTDDNTGYAVGWMGTGIKTTDGGTTWTNLPIETMRDLNSIYFPTSNSGYVVDEGGEIIKTTDAGNSWTFDSSGTWNDLMSVFFTDSTTGYVVGLAGTILKKGNGGVTFIKEHQPSETTFTICPNPANDKITITGKNMAQEEIRITIFTINGEQSMNETFRNQNQIKMDVSTLSKGTYLVKIWTKDTVEVKKLVIE